VPDPDLPFLGVHMTVSCSGKLYVGPTARPALGREHYEALSGIDWTEFPAQVARHALLLATNRNGFRRHAQVEVRRMNLRSFVEEARRLVPALELRHLRPSAKRGIRAQLYDAEKKTLEMDFVALDGPSSLHVLNAVSPGFTASFAFADYLVTRINGRETTR
jgi:L-2-hydroxyglutarate oxidase LhgO